MKKIAVCGVGNIGRVHASNLLSLRGCQVTGVFDTRPQILEQVAHEFSVQPYPSWQSLLEDSSLDAVVIASPAGSHRELCCDALIAGKHVFVEKPLAANLQDAEAIAEAEARSERVVQVGFCERFNPAYLEAKRAILEGRLGEVRAIHSSRFAPYHLSDPTWDLGVLDTAAHNLDLILWLTGKFPNKILARGSNVYGDAAIPHACAILLAFEDGLMAADYIAWVNEKTHPLSQCAKSEMFIQGKLGAFRVDHSWRPSWVMDDREFRFVDSVVLGGPEYYGCLKLQFDHFLRAIAGEVAPAVTAKGALLAERVVLAAQLSLKTGQEVSPHEPAR